MTQPKPDRPDADKLFAAGVSLAANCALAGLKFLAAGLTGSLALLGEAFHSSSDVLASGLVLFSVRVAAAPPDEEHPYGHAKVESVVGLAESVMLGLLGAYMVARGVERTARGDAVRDARLGALLALGAGLVSLVAALYVARAAKRTRSPALRTNGVHLFFDCASSMGAGLALLVTWWTKNSFFDALFAELLGLALVVNGWRLGREAFQELIDRRLPDSDLARIRAEIAETPELISAHRLRTRLGGSVRYIEFHAVVPNAWSVVRAHALADDLERRLKRGLAPAVVIIHVDPYDAAKAKPVSSAGGSELPEKPSPG